jgi:hypothetical protein
LCLLFCPFWEMLTFFSGFTRYWEWISEQ